jgi:DNA-binding NarL/FixJ family response regulator
MIRVIVADDDLLVREGMSALLSRADDIEVLASARDADSLLAAVQAHAPDVVLTDIRMPPTRTDEGIRAAQAIRTSHPRAG